MAAVAAPKRIVAAVVLVMVAAAVFGLPVAKSLSAGGFTDPTSESMRAAGLLASKFSHSDVPLLVVVTADSGVRSTAAVAVAENVISMLRTSPDVTDVTALWTAPPAAAPALTSIDGRSGIIIAGLKGSDAEFAAAASRLVSQLPPDSDGVSVRAGGALTYAEANQQAERDLVTMETVALPLTFVALVWVFGGLLAAALPLAVGIFSIFGSLAALRAITFVADVSLFAMNLAAAMSLALAVDYTLLIVSRYREEIAAGLPAEDALARTMATAGRTIVFSGLTVALCMSVMTVFPMYFLRSFAYAGVAVVLFAVVVSVVFTPAAIVLLGDRLDAYNVRRMIRRVLRRPAPPTRPLQESFWYRNTHSVMRHAIIVSAVLIAVLTLLGAPFLGVRWGFPDDRVLPAAASSRQVGDLMRTQFLVDPASNLGVVVPDSSGVSVEQLDDYAGRLSRVPDVIAVSSPTSTYLSGAVYGPKTTPAGNADGSAFLTVLSDAPLYPDASNEQLRALHEVPTPGGKSVLFNGTAQYNADSIASITSRLPLVLGIIGVITFVLLFLLTGSVVLPVKALILNVFSLTAMFGALVWIFQDGNLGGLGTTATGTLVANMPVLMFCIAFGLSMDYQIFVLARIREFWQASGGTRADNDESVALGVAHTGRVVTAAAVIMAVVFAGLLTAKVAFMLIFGLGLIIAVLVDAVVVRTLLLPALMRILGRANRWAPAPLVRLHRSIGLNEPDRAADSGKAAAIPGSTTAGS